MILFNDFPGWPGLEEEAVKDWLKTVCTAYEVDIKNLHYNFVDDARILQINRSHLSHNYPTDIISFGYLEGSAISGEIFISVETVVDNAKRFAVDKVEELHRVIVHGLLHLIGFDDQSEEEREVMREEEQKCLLLHAKFLKKK